MRSKTSLFIFIAIASLFLFIANLVIYEAVAHIFSINSTPILITFGVLLAILSGSFLAATILGMYRYNIFTRIYATITSVWIGLFVYLFLASVLYGIFLIFSFSSMHIIGMILIACAVLATLYGIIHSKDINVKEVNVPLKNVPPQWKGRKAVWISDLHLGQIHGPTFTRKIVKKIQEIPHDIIFIGGDLFDGTSAPDPTMLIAPLKELSPTLGIYFITGNHEEFGSSNAFISAVERAGIRVLQDKIIEIDGMQFIGVDYHTASDKNQFASVLSGLNIDTHRPSVLLKHEPDNLDVASTAGISFQISGHTHKAQMWPLSYIAEMVYKGYAYGLKKFGNVQVYTSSGVGTWGPPMRIGTDSEIVVFSFIEVV